MTANQIAYADVLVHQAAQKETERHNLATEELATQQNELTQRKIDNEAWYNQEMVRINNLRAYTEQDRVRIEWEKQAEQIRYNTTVNEIATAQTQINKELAIETQRHNLAQESAKTGELYISGKKLEFDKYAFDVGSDINWFNARSNYELGWENLLNSRNKIQFDYELGSKRVAVDWYNASTQAQNTRVRSNQLEFEKYKWNQEYALSLANQELREKELKSNTAAWIVPFVLPHADSIINGASRLIDRR